ncbi:TonB-dependent receptor [Malikia sp.]|uniref:TonB-dependent receptor domain-containing protein n=1 Tax=Malikia sp. TaxID=2070706 RepID=UPI002607F93E|nr:TonB-dependent receptor [Malikia sp.]MDD2729705.1 TonB-dependent receptor [Malikia sp.]
MFHLMKVCSSPARLAVLNLALAAALPALAQSPLKEVVVTATRVAQPLTDVVADVSIIDREAIERSGQSSLRELLAFQPGVQLVTNGGYRSSSGVFLRGAASSQTVVLIDGVRIGSATSGGAPLENIPLDRIERIEILRGAASALYGPDAVGGVIQIFTREPADELQLGAGVGAGTAGQRQANASLRGSSGALGYSLGLSREQGTGTSVVSNPAAGGYNPDDDHFKTESFDAKLTAKLSKEHMLTLGLMHSESEYQFDGAPPRLDNPLKLNPLTSDSWSYPKLDNTYVKWDAQWLPVWKSSLTLASVDEEAVSHYYRVADGFLGSSSKFNTQRQQATWQNDIAIGRDLLSLVLENRTETVDSTTSYTVKDRDTNSAVASYALNRNNWNALAVLRHDDSSQFGGFDNWALSGGYKLSGNLRAIASVGTSFQAPTFNQLYYPGYGNPTLTPQLNHAKEIGLKYSAAGLNFTGVVYRNEIDGFILPATNTQSSMAVLRGMTISADRQHGNSNYAISYDYADPRSRSSDPLTDNQRLVRVARGTLNMTARHRLGDVTVFGELKLASDREDNSLDFTGRDTLGGYALLNLGATWKLSKELSLLGRINNVTDKNYVLANGYSMPGRNAFVSLSWAR